METNQNKPIPNDKRRVNEVIFKNEKSTLEFAYSLLKKLTIVFVIYYAGYMNLSIVWFITPILLSETREYLSDTNIVRRKIAKASASGKEREIILASLKDLPSWVIQIV